MELPLTSTMAVLKGNLQAKKQAVSKLKEDVQRQLEIHRDSWLKTEVRKLMAYNTRNFRLKW